MYVCILWRKKISMFGQLQWNLSNLYTNGAEESVLCVLISEVGIHARVVLEVGKGVLVREVSSFQRLKEWYLWWVKVSWLERCPHFRG